MRHQTLRLTASEGQDYGRPRGCLWREGRVCDRPPDTVGGSGDKGESLRHSRGLMHQPPKGREKELSNHGAYEKYSGVFVDNTASMHQDAAFLGAHFRLLFIVGLCSSHKYWTFFKFSGGLGKDRRSGCCCSYRILQGHHTLPKRVLCLLRTCVPKMWLQGKRPSLVRHLFPETRFSYASQMTIDVCLSCAF